MADNGYNEKIIIAGFGGQGVMLAGKLLAQAVMVSEHEVTYMPAYGAEVRGGTANCMVVMSDEQIANPLVVEPDTLIVLNKASYRKFMPRVKAGGLLIYNSSKITAEDARKDVELVGVPMDDMASELGSKQSANMVAVGAYLRKRGLMAAQTAVDCLKDVLAARHHKTIPVNSSAILGGAEYVKNQ